MNTGTGHMFVVRLGWDRAGRAAHGCALWPPQRHHAVERDGAYDVIKTCLVKDEGIVVRSCPQPLRNRECAKGLIRHYGHCVS